MTKATKAYLIAYKSCIYKTSIRRILRNDLGLRACEVQNEVLLTNEHKEKRVRFTNWIRMNFRKENTMKIFFSDKKMFDIEEIYNSQNERIWRINRSATDTKGGLRQKQMFPEKVMA